MQYAVALSYASKGTSAGEAAEQVRYVGEVAGLLTSQGYRVFFDETGRAELLAKNLRDELVAIFSDARCTILFLSRSYAQSGYCKWERQAAQATETSHPHRAPLLARFDDAPIEGIVATAAYTDLRRTTSRQLFELVVEHLRAIGVAPSDQNPGTSEERYGLVFGIPGFRVAYIPSRASGLEDHYHEWPLEALSVECDRTAFALPERFKDWTPAQAAQNLARCRLVSYSATQTKLRLTLAETSYTDYLRSGELLDFTTMAGTPRTLREEFLSNLKRDGGDRGYLEPFTELTNICGVGIFVITRDNHVVVTTHSSESHVYPGRRTFSASGTMPWGAWPHPYTAIAQKAQQEIQHLVDPLKLKLFAFGVDARKLYFQFSFVEDRSDFTWNEIRSHYDKWGSALSTNRPRELSSLAFDPMVICKSLVDECWEPAAEAALLALLAYRRGDEVRRALEWYRDRWWKRRMRDEWDHRASRPDVLPDMSVRYDRSRLSEASKAYIDHAFRFMGGALTGKSVVEIGPGTGRFSERLVGVVKTLTCVELSNAMIRDHQKRLGQEAASRITYKNNFAQDTLAGERYDVAICSLVLIHNVGEREFHELVRCLCECATTIFVFEDVSRDRRTSPATRLRPADELIAAFAKQGVGVSAHEDHTLFDDQIAFLRFER